MASTKKVNNKEEGSEIIIDLSERDRLIVTTTLELKILEKLDDLARERKTTRSNIMRLALSKYLDRLQKIYGNDKNKEGINIRVGVEVDPEVEQLINLISYRTKIPKAEILRQAILFFIFNKYNGGDSNGGTEHS